MKLSTNLVRFHSDLGLKGAIDLLAQAGFQGIDFNTDMEEYHTDAHGPGFYRQIRAYAEDKGLVIGQAHAPFPSNFPEPEQTRQRFAQILKGMEHSALLGAKMIVIHPYKQLQDLGKDYWMEQDRNLYRSLVPYAEDLGIQIAIENIRNTTTAAPEGLLELLDLLDDPVFTVCYDVGHANISGQDPAGMLRKLAGRIGCTHIHDNDGVTDQHLLPYYGTIRWEEVMQALAESGYAGNLNYEAAYFLKKVPAELLPEGARYMAQVGHQLIRRFHNYQGV